MVATMTVPCRSGKVHTEVLFDGAWWNWCSALSMRPTMKHMRCKFGKTCTKVFYNGA